MRLPFSSSAQWIRFHPVAYPDPATSQPATLIEHSGNRHSSGILFRGATTLTAFDPVI